MSNRLTAAVLRRTLRVPFLSMPNLIAGSEIVPELLQQEASGQRISDVSAGLLDDENSLSKMKMELAKVVQKLGEPGAAARTAAICAGLMNKSA